MWLKDRMDDKIGHKYYTHDTIRHLERKVARQLTAHAPDRGTYQLYYQRLLAYVSRVEHDDQGRLLK
jgi:hypothetical protein